MAGQAIRSVALGIVVTALGQSVLGGAGLALAGLPLAAVLTAIMFLLCIAQLGPLPVLVPAVVWLYWSGDSLWGTLLVVWSVLLSTMDSVVRPLLIRKGAHSDGEFYVCPSFNEMVLKHQRIGRTARVAQQPGKARGAVQFLRTVHPASAPSRDARRSRACSRAASSCRRRC